MEFIHNIHSSSPYHAETLSRMETRSHSYKQSHGDVEVRDQDHLCLYVLNNIKRGHVYTVARIQATNDIAWLKCQNGTCLCRVRAGLMEIHYIHVSIR